MKSSLAIYIPNYNGESYLSKMKIFENVDYIIMDNASVDGSKKIAEERGFIFVENEKNVGRIKNWTRCIEHFRKSQYGWMKWLFIGDELCDNFLDLASKAINDYNDAAVIIFDYRLVFPNREIYKRLLVSTAGYIEYGSVPELLLTEGNIFGAPLGWMVSKKANLNCIDSNILESYPWAGDMYMAYMLVKGNRIAYCPDIVGTFSASCRKNYSVNRTSPFSIIEELEILRLIYQDNEENVSAISKKVRTFIMSKMELCIENNANTWSDVLFLIRCLIRTIVKRMLRR